MNAWVSRLIGSMRDMCGEEIRLRPHAVVKRSKAGC